MTLIAFSATAQHHLKGSKGFDVGGGLTKHGVFGDVNFDMNLDSKLFVKAGLIAEFGEGKSISYKTFLLDIGGYYNVASLGNKLYINPGV